MDTLSRDSNNSGSIMPLVGAIAGGLALVLSIVALVKLSTLQKTV
ncbi:MAG: LysM domain protein, partial [Lacunisphaera sp.]|nr:LysM domain protein [Lacunisphaera sp.]